MILQLGQNLRAAEQSIGHTKKRKFDDAETEEDDGDDDEHMGHRIRRRKTRFGNRRRSTSHGVDNHDIQPGQTAQDRASNLHN